MIQTSQQSVKKAKATWDDETTRIFCEVCAEEVHAGNRPHSHFTKLGWDNVVRKFHRRSVKKYDQKQLKNKWEKMKTEFTTWKSLVHKETGLGWDHDKNTINASDSWWEKQGNENVAAFRDGGMKNEKEMEVMFCKIYATHASSWTPYTDEVTGEEEETPLEAEDAVHEIGVAEDCSLNTPPSVEVPVANEGNRQKNMTTPSAVKSKAKVGSKSKVSTAATMRTELK